MHESKLKRYRWMLKLMGWFQIPMIAYVRPKLLELNQERVALRIRLRRRTKNHLKSMYFGVMAVGADVAAGLHVFYFCDELNVKPAFAFKGMQAEFVKRAETHVTFVCTQGTQIREQVELAKATGERQNHWVDVLALNDQQEEVARFRMEISVKVSS